MVDVSELGRVEAVFVIADVPDDPTTVDTGVAVDDDFVGSSVIPGVEYSIVLISE